MAQEQYVETLDLPEGIDFSSEKGMISVKGQKGEVKKNLFSPIITISKEGSTIKLTSKKLTKKSKKLTNTFKAHIANTFKGVTEGHVYKLKICSGHFPMTVVLKGKVIEIKNFIGEKVPRTLTFKEGVNVKIDGTLIVVDSIDKELAGQGAASIEQLTKRPGFDRRIFQDGIYITEKDGKKI